MTEVKKKKSQGSANRDKGHRKERELATLFKDLGYTHCKTSRQASRLLDDSKVDLWGIPFNVQSKAGYPKGLNYTTIFQDMKEALSNNFPPEDKQHEYPMMIFHDKGRKEEEKLVVMKENEFVKLLGKKNE
jgi:hypothetical protein